MRISKQETSLLDKMVLSTKISIGHAPSPEQRAVALQCHRAMLLDGTAEGLDALKEVLSFGVSGKACLILAFQFNAEKVINYLIDNSFISDEGVRDAILEAEVSGNDINEKVIDFLSKKTFPLSYEKCPGELSKILDVGALEYAEKLALSWDLNILPQDEKDLALLNLMKAVFVADASFRVEELDLSIVSNLWSQLLKAGANPYRVWNLSSEWDDRLAPQEPTSWWPISSFRSVIPPPSACPAQLLIIAYNVLEPRFIEQRNGKDSEGYAWWAEMSAGIDPQKIPNDYLDRGPWSLVLTSHKNGSGCCRVLDNAGPIFDWLEKRDVNPKDDMWPIWEMAFLLYQRGNLNLFHYLLENNSDVLIPPDNESLKNISPRVAAMFGPGPSTTGIEGVNLTLWWHHDAKKWGEQCLEGIHLVTWNDQISRMQLVMKASKNGTSDLCDALRQDASLHASSLWNTLTKVRPGVRL